jgi:stress-induced morphogen
MVYAALADLMETEIHALSIEAVLPLDEGKSRTS